MGTFIIMFAIFVAIIGIISFFTNNDGKVTMPNPKETDNLKRIEHIFPQSCTNKYVINLVNCFYDGKLDTDFNKTFTSKEEQTELFKQIAEEERTRCVSIQLSLIQRNPKEINPNNVRFIPNPREIVYGMGDCGLNTVQKLYKNIMYNGIRANYGGLRNGVGTLRVDDVSGFKSFGAGKFYVTNQKIVFVSYDGSKSKTIPLGKIISYSPFENNGIIFNIANSTPIIADFNVDGMIDLNDDIVYDGKVRCLYALDHVFSMR